MKDDEQYELELGKAQAAFFTEQRAAQDELLQRQSASVREELRRDLERQQRALEDAIKEDTAKVEAELQERQGALLAEHHRQIAALAVEGAPERAKAIAKLEFETAEFAAKLDAEKERATANREREIAALRLSYLAGSLDLVPDDTLVGLATTWSALPDTRAEFDRVVAAYSDPASKISKAGGWLGDLISSFVSTSGGPFTQSEIEEIRRAEKDRAEALQAVQQAVELAEQVDQARKRCAMLQAAVDAGVQLEELAPEYAVPGDED